MSSLDRPTAGKSFHQRGNGSSLVEAATGLAPLLTHSRIACRLSFLVPSVRGSASPLQREKLRTR